MSTCRSFEKRDLIGERDVAELIATFQHPHTRKVDVDKV